MKRFITRSLISSLMAMAAPISLVMGGDAAASEAEHNALIKLAREPESDFDAAFASAKESGMSESWLLEAEIVRALSTSDLKALLAMPDRIDAVSEDFRFGLDRTFISGLHLEGLSDTISSVDAYYKGDMEQFEQFAVSSYAKAPDFNKLFGLGDLLARYRTQQVQDIAMAEMAIPMDLQLTSVEGETLSLRDWMGDNKAMLVDFWASWCGPCIRLMPSLRDKSTEISPKGILVAGVNTDDSDQLAKAKRVREQHDMGSVPWLMDDSDGQKLNDLLMIDSIPRMVLFDAEGKVLYNGHPSDPALYAALAKIDPSLAH